MTVPYRPTSRRVKRSPWLGLAAAALAISACSSSGSATTVPSTAATSLATSTSAPPTEPAASAVSSPSAAAASIELFPGMASAAAADTVDTTPWKKDLTRPKIGYAINGLVNSFQVQRLESAKLVAAELGADFVVANADNDANKQVSDVQDLLAQGVDALMISPINPDALKGVLGQASAAKVPVVVEGQNVAPSPDVTSQIFYSNVAFGKVGGQGLCDILGGHGNVVMLRGIAGYQAEKDRYDAAKQVMEGCGLKVIGEAYGDWSFAGGLKATQTLLQKYPNIDGVWSSGSEMTRAAIQVFQQANRPLVPMTGESENGYLQIWQSSGLKGVAPIFPTWQTPEAVKVALKILRGEPVLAQYDLQLPPITNENLGQFVKADLSKDWWSDGFVGADGTVTSYLTPEQVKQIFPGG